MTPCAGLSDLGRRRANEDRWLADIALGLYVVADGLGGTQGGEQAAQMIVDGLPPLLRKTFRGIRDLADPRAAERFRDALGVVSDQVYQQSCKHPDLKGMGAAVVAALVWERQALIAHLGDCRAYLFHDGFLEQLTRDHSRLQALIDQGEMSPDDSVHQPALFQLTRYAGSASHKEADVLFRELSPGDRLLLCSDGLFTPLTTEDMVEILGLDQSPAEICARLIDAAELHADDNITAVVVRI
jgi:protein phosphatase